MRGCRRRGAAATAGRLVAPALALLTALIVTRLVVATGARGAVSDVCVPPVPVGASCSTTASTTTSTSRSSQSTVTSESSTTATTTETQTTSTGSSTTAGGSTTTTSTASSASGTRSTASASASPPASRFPPPPPPLPAASPGAAPVAAEAVQRIVLVPAAAGPIAPGDTVEVQATLEAQRGTDIFAVPHVPVVFALVSASGGGASLTPSRVDSGDTGVALVRVRTGDVPGDTVVSATSGTASAQLALHSDVRATGAAVHVNSPATGTDTSSRGGPGLLWVAGLIVAGALGAAGMTLHRRPVSSG